MTPEEDYTEFDVSAKCRVSRRTLATWRSKGTGPAFRRFGQVVLYPIGPFETWWASTVHYTRDVPPPVAGVTSDIEPSDPTWAGITTAGGANGARG